jgi:hypothetical protein
MRIACCTWQLVVTNDGHYERCVSLEEKDENKARVRLLKLKVLPQY